MPLFAIPGIIAGALGAAGTAAAIGGAATVAGAAINAHATGKAADAARKAADASLAQQKEIYNLNSGNLQPTIQRGNAAGDLLSSFMGLGGDPEKAHQALQTYLGSTGFNFELDTGSAAITGNKAASHLLDSGSALKDLTRFGQGLASTRIGSYFDRLQAVSSQGTQGAAALAGVGTNYANAVTGINQNAADTTANAALSGAANTNSLIASALGAVGYGRGQSSYSDLFKPKTAPVGGAAPGWNESMGYS